MINEIFNNTMANMKWTDIQYHVGKKSIVLLPLGVIEEHGPHLCLGTDIYIAHIQCNFIREKLIERGHDTIIAPPFYWGICQSTGTFTGSFKIRKETAKALIFDILASLAEFGFKNIYGINAHGDIDHSISIIEAFKEAGEKLGINARYTFDEWRLQPFGLSGSEQFISPIKPQTVKINNSVFPDVHAGDIETATMYRFFPKITDVEMAKSLPPVTLGDDKIMTWLFGGHTAELSPEGYLGAPADFEKVDVLTNLNDIALRITDTVLKTII